MELLAVGAVVAAIGAWMAWRLVLAPGRPSLVLGGLRWSVDQGVLTAEAAGERDYRPFRAPANEVLVVSSTDHHLVDRHRGASSHSSTVGTMGPHGVFVGSTTTVHTEARSWQEKGAKYVTVGLIHANQARANERMLLQSEAHLGLGDGSVWQQNEGVYLAPKTASMSPGDYRLLQRWMRRHGATGTPDTSAQEQRFPELVAPVLRAVRERYGFAEGDLDHLRLTPDLDPVSYVLVRANGDLVAHHVAKDLTLQRPLSACTFSGLDYGRGRLLPRVFIPGPTPRDGVSVPMSTPMLMPVGHVLNARGQSFPYSNAR